MLGPHFQSHGGIFEGGGLLIHRDLFARTDFQLFS